MCIAPLRFFLIILGNYYLGLFIQNMALAVGASYIAKRNFHFCRGKICERLLALGVAVLRVSQETGLVCHGMLGSMLRMLGHANLGRSIGEDRSSLSECGGSGEEKKQSECGGFHSHHPGPGENVVHGATVLMERTRKIRTCDFHPAKGQSPYQTGASGTQVRGSGARQEQLFCTYWGKRGEF